MSPTGSDKTQPATMAPMEGLGQAPLVSRARDAILEAILDGRFDERLPPEDELATMLSVSRTTVRAAVQDLERDGVLTRRRAIGTTINRHVGVETLALQRLVGFDRLLEEQGHKVKVDVRWERRTAMEMAPELPWDGELECCVIDKHYFADGRLSIALRDYIPWSELRDERLPTRLTPSLFDFSRKYLKRAIDSAVVKIKPMVARTASVTELDLTRGHPFIRLHETHFAANAEPMAWTYVDVDDRILRFEVFRSQH